MELVTIDRRLGDAPWAAALLERRRAIRALLRAFDSQIEGVAGAFALGVL